MTDASSVFDQVVRRITDNIANATPKERVLICRVTFRGIKELLAPPLKGIPEKSVCDAENSLYKIMDEYRKLEDGRDVEQLVAELCPPVVLRAVRAAVADGPSVVAVGGGAVLRAVAVVAAARGAAGP